MNEHTRPAVQGPVGGDVRHFVASQSDRGSARLSVIERLLEYVRLVGRLMADVRVSVFDRIVVLLAVAYVISPLDLIPDVLPVIGQIDDVMILVAAVTRLFEHAGRDVILSHWRGSPDELDAGWLKKLAFVFSFFFPKASRRRLRSFSKA